MDNLKKTTNLTFKVGIPKHVSSGTFIHHPLGMVANTHWGIDIVITRDGHPPGPFNLTRNFLNVTTQVKLHCFGLEGKVFAVGNIKFAINVFPSFEVNVCKKQFHHLFQEGRSTEVRNECIAKKMDQPLIEYLRNSKNYLYIGGDVTFYSVQESDKSPEDEEDYLGYEAESSLHLKSSRHEILNELSKNLKYVFKEHILTDLNLRCGSEVIQAHKAILSGRSPVFAAMFQNPMKESAENEVVIEGMDPHILQAMLEYLYSGRIKELTNLAACELMSAAERYQLAGLKKICALYLESRVSVNNVLSVLQYADLHDEKLKKSAIELICKHYDYLKTTPEWDSLQSDRSSLIMEVMSSKIQLLSKNNN